MQQETNPDWEQGIRELEETLRMTKPDGIGMKGILKGLLTYNEIVILINIARGYRKLGRREEGIEILYGLKRYMDTHIIDCRFPPVSFLPCWNIAGRLPGIPAAG